MDEYNEEADFDYEDVIECLKKFISQPKIKEIFGELELSQKDILKIADQNLIDAEEGETVIEYCKRYILFLLIIEITKEYVKEVEEKVLKEEITGVEDREIEGTKFLNSFAEAFEDGNINKIINLIVKNSIMPVKVTGIPKGELSLSPAQVTRYQAYIKSYQDDLLVELEKYGNILKKNILQSSKEETEENIENKKASNSEEFSHDKEYYKQFILTSKKHNEDYIKKHPEDTKVILIFKKETASVEDYFEAVRFYNKINSHIIASISGMKLKAKDYNSKEEMIEIYNRKLKK